MKLLLSTLLLFCIPVAGLFAQVPDRVDFYADTGLTTCELNISPPCLFEVHMVHSGPGPSVGIIFAAPKSACMGSATWLGDAFVTSWLFRANTQIGMDVAYGLCLPLPVYLGTIRYYATAQTEPCCEYRAGIQPVSGRLAAFDCSFSERLGEPGRKVVINPNDGCRCDHPLPANTSTWGGVKALYR